MSFATKVLLIIIVVQIKGCQSYCSSEICAPGSYPDGKCQGDTYSCDCSCSCGSSGGSSGGSYSGGSSYGGSDSGGSYSGGSSSSGGGGSWGCLLCLCLCCDCRRSGIDSSDGAHLHHAMQPWNISQSTEAFKRTEALQNNFRIGQNHSQHAMLGEEDQRRSYDCCCSTCRSPSQPSCSYCVAGKYSKVSGASSCSECLAGSYLSASG